MAFFSYLFEVRVQWLQYFMNHLWIVTLALPLSVVIGVPLGVWMSFHPRAAKWILNFTNALMTIPSLALFGIMVIVLAPLNASLGVPPTVISLVLYSLLPITRNTMVAVQSIDPAMISAARGMGMTKLQLLLRIRLPLSIPILLAGIRTVAVMGVGVATLAQLIGANSIGYYIFVGLSRTRIDMVVLGSLSVAVMGLAVNYLFIFFERALTPRGLKIQQEDSKHAH